MAISHGTATVTVQTQDRTWRSNIETPDGADPVMTFHREEIRKEGDAVIARNASIVVTRRLSDVADQEFEVGNKPCPVSDIFAALVQMSDTFRQQDIDAAAAATAAAKAAAEAAAEASQPN
jgi:hypothetical protein